MFAGMPTFGFTVSTLTVSTPVAEKLASSVTAQLMGWAPSPVTEAAYGEATPVTSSGLAPSVQVGGVETGAVPGVTVKSVTPPGVSIPGARVPGG